MSRRTLFTALALAACAPDDEPAQACPLDQRVRLAGVPEGWQPKGNQRLSFVPLGDYFLYRYDAYDDPRPTYWLVDRCGGDPERFTPADGSVSTILPLSTAEGLVVYARDLGSRLLVLDRLDVPGFDQPRPVSGLPDEPFTAGVTSLGLYINTRRTPENFLLGAAGIGAPAEAVYMHHGDPAAPAVLIGDPVVNVEFFDDHLLALDDDGDLRVVDPRTGAAELLLTGVRHYTVAAPTRRLIWQQLGDDLVEPIFLRDLDSGEDVEIAVNAFTALSWNRPGLETLRDVGRWALTDDLGHAALIGPERAPAAVVRLEDAAAVAPPPGLRVRLGSSFGAAFGVQVDDPDALVLALWDPDKGELLEWYRAPLGGTEPRVVARTDDHLDYILPDPNDSGSTLWRLDLATGDRAVRVPRLGIGTVELDDGRFFTVIPSSAYGSLDAVLFDPDSGRYTTFAADIDGFALYPDQGLFYTDAVGPAKGLWAAPIPPK